MLSCSSWFYTKIFERFVRGVQTHKFFSYNLPLHIHTLFTFKENWTLAVRPGVQFFYYIRPYAVAPRGKLCENFHKRPARRGIIIKGNIGWHMRDCRAERFNRVAAYIVITFHYWSSICRKSFKCRSV